jgi:hypothetical protein
MGLTRVKNNKQQQQENNMSEQQESKKYYFNGMPIRDAVRPLYMQLEKVDVEKGVPQDPENCAFAECLKRNLGVQYARIDRTCALVERLDNGRSVLERYMVRGQTRSYVEIFDNIETLDKKEIRNRSGNLMVPLSFFKLWPPSPSECLGYKTPVREIPYANSKQPSRPQPKGEGVKFGPVPTPKPIPVKVSPLRNSTGKIRFERY